MIRYTGEPYEGSEDQADDMIRAQEALSRKPVMKVKIYEVVVPSIYAWPPGCLTLKVCFDEDTAQQYIDNHPNMFLRPFMSITTVERDYPETD